ncbi:MAG: VIT1/CCC1 transporter family protein, partial [Ktedonobacterales bacterium]
MLAGSSNEELHPHGGGWLREIVFGLNDGLVTTLVFIMTLSSVVQATPIVLIALSEVAAGGISMFLGGYLSARTEREILDQRIATERWEIAHEPDEERAELRAIYRDKGLQGELLDRVVGQLTADEERWLRALAHDEHGIVADEPTRPAWRQGVLIGVAFVVGGLIPTLPFLVHLPQPRYWA